MSGRKPGAGALQSLLAAPGEFFRIWRALKAWKPDVAICAMPNYPDLLLVAMLRLMRIRTAIIVHEVEGHPGDTHAYLYPVQRAVVRLCTSVITLSDHVARQVERRWPRKPLLRGFHPPFAFADLQVPPPQPLKGQSGPLRLLLSGRMWAYKGTALALEAMKTLPKGTAELRIVGQGEKTEAALPEGTVVENRWLTEAGLIAEIDQADLVIFPYTEASQSGLIPLALSRGRPVIVTPVGGLAEQVRDRVDGIVLDAVDAPSLASAVISLSSSPGQVAEMSANALAGNTPQRLWQDLAMKLTAFLTPGC